MRVVWIDLCFAINFCADYLICLLSARLCAVPLSRRRYALAAAFGALWAVAAACGLAFCLSPGGKLLGGAALCLCAFYGQREFARLCTSFFILSAALGGSVWALSLRPGGALALSPGLLGFGFFLFWALFDLLLRGAAARREREILEVKLRFLGRETAFRALVDTGNSLSEPVSGAHVMVVSPEALRGVLGEYYPLFLLDEPTEILEAAACLDALRGRLCLVPYFAVGAKGFLVAFRPDSLTIVGKEDGEKLLVALSSSASGEGHEGIF
ncbi:MAG: sigma-E processing peptidase SpoIIGA [Oscillospiraceae bacterium]|nr:sigma-E processing peptidase SpoIIGA [Oscillospiraceae bacterium]